MMQHQIPIQTLLVAPTHVKVVAYNLKFGSPNAFRLR